MPRFSIAGLMAVTAIIALHLACWHYSWEAGAFIAVATVGITYVSMVLEPPCDDCEFCDRVVCSAVIVPLVLLPTTGIAFCLAEAAKAIGF